MTISKTNKNLYQKILAVQKEVDTVPKRGFNSFQKYHYATEADILTIKENLNKHGLVVLPTTESQETGFTPSGRSWARVTLLFRVVDVETGDSIESQFIGYSEDINDKAIYKATTGANKYFYLKFFGLATEDDPEREDIPNTRPQNRIQVKPFAGTPEKKSPASDENNRTQALAQANKILALQKAHNLTIQEIQLYGGIDSIKELAEEGNAKKLSEAYTSLLQHVQNLQKAI